MSKISKFLKLDTNVLMEYIYDDSNLIGESYDILINSKTSEISYIATSTSATNNIISNQLFNVDNITQKYAKVDTSYYSFLQLKEYSDSKPLRHDTIKIHLPISWTFGEYLGFYINVYTFDKNNRYTYNLSNYYFDATDLSQQYMMNYTSPAFLFQEKMWGKYIQIEIPSVSEVSTQLTNSLPTENSLNANLTQYNGLSLTSPIFINFKFITNTQTINSIKTYTLSADYIATVPQTPEFEKLGLKIEPSSNGDYFEVYGTYNGTKSEFNLWMEESYTLGHRYYVEYNITQYEQGIRGKTVTYMQMDEFSESVDYRPIIRYSTSTAIINVEMKVIDAVDNSYITRTAAYGMLQDEVSKYALNLTKIDLEKASKPKIYNVRSVIDYSLVNLSNSFGKITSGGSLSSNGLTKKSYNASTVVKSVSVAYPILANFANVVGKSDNAYIGTTIYYGNTKMMIMLYPFDNVVKFTLANGSESAPDILDLTSYGDIKMVFKDDNYTYEYTLYTNTNECNTAKGQLVFKIPSGDYANLKKLYTNSGINTFYITATKYNTTTVLYTGLFKTYDNRNVVNDTNVIDNAFAATLKTDPSIGKGKATAIVTIENTNIANLLGGKKVSTATFNSSASSIIASKNTTSLSSVSFKKKS